MVLPSKNPEYAIVVAEFSSEDGTESRLPSGYFSDAGGWNVI